MSSRGCEPAPELVVKYHPHLYSKLGDSTVARTAATTPISSRGGEPAPELVVKYHPRLYSKLGDSVARTAATTPMSSRGCKPAPDPVVKYHPHLYSKLGDSVAWTTAAVMDENNALQSGAKLPRLQTRGPVDSLSVLMRRLECLVEAG